MPNASGDMGVRSEREGVDRVDRSASFASRLPFVLALLAALVLHAELPAVRAQQAIDAPEVVAQIGGSLRLMAGEGDRLYAVVGSRVRIFDATRHPLGPILGETEPMTQTVQAVAASGSWLFVAGGWANAGALIAIDAADPRAPRSVGRLALRGVPDALVVDGDVLWMLVGSVVWAVDVAEPARPRLVGHWGSPQKVTHLQAGGGWALALAWTSMQPGDVAELIGLSIVDGRIEEQARVSTGMLSVALFACDGSWGILANDAGTRSVRVSEGEIEVKRLERAMAVSWAALIDGEKAWLLSAGGQLHRLWLDRPGGDPWSSDDSLGEAGLLVMAGGRLWAGGSGGLALAEVDTEPPAIVGDVDIGGRVYRDVADHGGRGFVALTEDELVLESDVARPRPTLALPLPRGLQPARRLAKGSRHLLVAGEELLGRAPATSPADGLGARLSEAVLYTDESWQELEVVGDLWLGATRSRAYLGSYNEQEASPWGEIVELPGWAPAALAPPFAWLAWGTVGLSVFDVRDPAHPEPVALYRLPAGAIATDLALVAGHLVVADGRGRLMVLDVSDARAPRVRADLDFGAGVSGLEARGERVWISWHDGQRPRVSLFDLRDPERPTELWDFSTFGPALDVAPARGHIVTLSEGALSVFELPSDLPAPRSTPPPRATPTFWAPTPTSTATPMPTWTPPRVDPSPTTATTPREPSAGRVWLPWALVGIEGVAAD